MKWLLRVHDTYMRTHYWLFRHGVPWPGFEDEMVHRAVADGEAGLEVLGQLLRDGSVPMHVLRRAGRDSVQAEAKQRIEAEQRAAARKRRLDA